MKLELKNVLLARKAAAACPYCEPVEGGDSGRFLIDPRRWDEALAWRDMTAEETAQHAKFVAWRSAQNALCYAKDAAEAAVLGAFKALSDAEKLAAILGGPHAVRYSDNRYRFTVLTKHGASEWGGKMGAADIVSDPEYLVAQEDWETFGWRMISTEMTSLAPSIPTPTP